MDLEKENKKLKEALEYWLKENKKLIEENEKLREALYGKIRFANIQDKAGDKLTWEQEKWNANIVEVK